MSKTIEIPNELLDEILNERDRRLTEELKQFTYESIVKSLYQVQKPQSKTVDDILWKALADAVREGGSGVEARLVAIFAGYIEKANKPEGAAIYQYFNNIYKKVV